MNHAFPGGCACGAVRYVLGSEPFDAGWCHCRICQLNSGAPAMVFAGVRREDFVFTQGADQVKTFQSSDFGHRLFCGACGTPLAMEVDDEPVTIDFSVATLDDPGLVAPEFHIFNASKIAWFETADDLPRHERSRPKGRD
ncbi:GFA family protein [Enterovirga sp. GCM10030262]|uniref:GFA family protein n=1 Tax=Enterovirga sp. GCM10030262 TaxID=3273391 RepID=UPI003617898D